LSAREHSSGGDSGAGSPDPAAVTTAAPYVLPDFVEGGHRIHFAASPAELEKVLRLRYEVFNLELDEGLEDSRDSGLDRDPFDAYCHHLMVSDLRGDEVIGTYRMQTYEMARENCGFYTAQEFELGTLPASLVERSVELGRACIAREHRNGSVLFALWRGLAAFLERSRKRHLFGCCSLSSQDLAEGRRMQRFLERHDHMHPDLRVAPLDGLGCGEAGPRDDRAVRVPQLFRTYLRFGAKACGPPAIDRAFKTIDFLVILDSGTLSARIRRLFFDGLPPLDS
jgi:putative hemolysin